MKQGFTLPKVAVIISSSVLVAAYILYESGTTLMSGSKSGHIGARIVEQGQTPAVSGGEKQPMLLPGSKSRSVLFDLPTSKPSSVTTQLPEGKPYLSNLSLSGTGTDRDRSSGSGPSLSDYLNPRDEKLPSAHDFTLNPPDQHQREATPAEKASKQMKMMGGSKSRAMFEPKREDPESER